jgi:hypothetical protein
MREFAAEIGPAMDAVVATIAAEWAKRDADPVHRAAVERTRAALRHEILPVAWPAKQAAA